MQRAANMWNSSLRELMSNCWYCWSIGAALGAKPEAATGEVHSRAAAEASDPAAGPCTSAAAPGRLPPGQRHIEGEATVCIEVADPKADLVISPPLMQVRNVKRQVIVR